MSLVVHREYMRTYLGTGGLPKTALDQTCKCVLRACHEHVGRWGKQTERDPYAAESHYSRAPQRIAALCFASLCFAFDHILIPCACFLLHGILSAPWKQNINGMVYTTGQSELDIAMPRYTKEFVVRSPHSGSLQATCLSFTLPSIQRCRLNLGLTFS